MVKGVWSDRLVEAIGRTGTSVCVGLDPDLDLLPPQLTDGLDPTFEAAAGALFRFSRDIVDAVSDLVPAIKIQIAFFERYGAAGYRALERVVEHAQSRGLLVVVDAKRGDIGSTSAAYADWLLGTVPVPGGGRQPGLGADALTVNPYLGPESLEPFLDRARRFGRGLFVLVRTTNPGAGAIQELGTADGGTVAGAVAALVRGWSEASRGRYGYGDVGAVVAGTEPAMGAKLRKQMPGVLFLVPGYGAQGAGAADVAALADQRGGGVLVNASRSLIFAWRDCPGQPYAEACRDRTRAMIEQLRAAGLGR